MPPLGSLLRPLSQVVTSRLGRGAGGVGGAAYGALSAEEDESPALRALGYGALGGAVLPMGAEAVMRGYRTGGMSGALTDYTYFSFLSSPDTILRGNFGAIGGAVQAALEKGLQGIAHVGRKGAMEDIKDGARILKSIAADGYGIYRDAMKANPAEFQRMYRKYMPKDLERIAGIPEQYTGGVGIGRFFSAPDMVAVNAMTKGGFSRADAARYTLTGTPESDIFRSGLQQFQQWKQKGPVRQFVGTQLAPFARVGLLGMEKGLQRTPVIGGFVHDAMKTGATRTQKLIQQGIGAGAAGLGYHAEDMGVDPRFSLVGAPLLGPAFLPFQAGREIRRLRERGEPVASIPLKVAGEVMKETSPLGFQPGALFLNPSTEIPRRLIPAGVADVAEALDPAFGRERGTAALRSAAQRGEYGGPTGSTMAGTISQIPGLREQLPETFAPVDIFGQPRYETPNVLNWGPVTQGLSRAIFPTRESAAPPAMNMLDPQMQQLAALGITPGPPSARVNLPGTGLPLQQTAQSAAATQRVGGMPPKIAAQVVTQILGGPRFQAMPPAQRNWIAGVLFDQIRRGVTNAMGAARLATSLSSGAQLPAVLTGTPQR